MATLRAHGQLLGKITYITYTCAYMSDGVILRSFGNGWKRYRKVKDGIDPAEHFKTKLANFEQRIATHPAWAEYRKMLHELVGKPDWSRVHQTIEMLGDDVDGVWSELNDYRPIGLDVDELADLCAKYKAMRAELDAANHAKIQVASRA